MAWGFASQLSRTILSSVKCWQMEPGFFLLGAALYHINRGNSMPCVLCAFVDHSYLAKGLSYQISRKSWAVD